MSRLTGEKIKKNDLFKLLPFANLDIRKLDI